MLFGLIVLLCICLYKSMTSFRCDKESADYSQTDSQYSDGKWITIIYTAEILFSSYMIYLLQFDPVKNFAFKSFTTLWKMAIINVTFNFFLKDSPKILFTSKCFENSIELCTMVAELSVTSFFGVTVMFMNLMLLYLFTLCL